MITLWYFAPFEGGGGDGGCKNNYERINFQLSVRLADTLCYFSLAHHRPGRSMSIIYRSSSIPDSKRASSQFCSIRIGTEDDDAPIGDAMGSAFLYGKFNYWSESWVQRLTVALWPRDVMWWCRSSLLWLWCFVTTLFGWYCCLLCKFSNQFPISILLNEQTNSSLWRTQFWMIRLEKKSDVNMFQEYLIAVHALHQYSGDS